MSPKRILLVLDDPFLSRFYREKLEATGFQVDLARDIAHGLDCLREEPPQLLVLDPLLPGSDAVQFIEEIRAAELGAGMSIIVLPTPHYGLSQRIETDPQVTMLKPTTNPLGDLVKHASEILQGTQHNEASLMLTTLPDEAWRQAAAEAAQATVADMRHRLHDLARAGSGFEALAALTQDVHRLTGQTGLLTRTSLSTISTALEVMVYNLSLYPERLDPLALRTLGQAIDFMAVLLSEDTYARVPEIGAANIMIIEDEASARELIIAAMELVGLQARGLETPNGGLTALGSSACDLIFLDINLPEMNGFDLCNKVRSLPLHERTPIVFLTGMASFQNRVQSSLSGGNDFIGKPFNVAELGVKALMWVMKGKLGLN